ncbi:hypothetical protein KIN20_026138 [Parelaphostrongylus tenuis]|uniref:Uncharacterized protein n=1 Tax=Parelaphostrongylus tenuis TaxID=148309 RepID=A0AAD5NA04_PARTN|nr:hypothetical protein KIN20_026138 [Parelaphostrongylus tenuis]
MVETTISRTRKQAEARNRGGGQAHYGGHLNPGHIPHCCNNKKYNDKRLTSFVQNFAFN